MRNSSVGIVVPTLGQRPEFIVECLESIRAAGDAYVLIVAPASADLSKLDGRELFDERIVDPGTGLAAAIHLGLTSLPSEIEFVNWLGDDDRLIPDSIRKVVIALENKGAAFAYGGCQYIDAAGHILWRNGSGRWATPLMRFGPDLVPQPGALIRRTSYIAAGGLNTEFGWAFDLDLFIRLNKLGGAAFVKEPVSQFRWHAGSLSVGKRGGSASESLAVRRLHLPKLVRRVSFLWEYPFILLSSLAAARLSRKGRSSH